MSSLDADVVIVGAGASGLSLARRLVDAPEAGGEIPSVILVEQPPGPAGPAESTWCFWDEPDGEYDELVAARFRRLLVRDREGRAVTGTAPRPYKMLRSADFVGATAHRLASLPGVRRFPGVVTGARDLPGGGGRVDGEDAEGRRFRLTGRWVFDSRPPQPPPARTTLLQHFRGWFLSTRRECFDPAVAELMDFRTPQPETGLSFAYVLPLSSRDALVEYTEFSPRPLSSRDYDAALRHYTGTVRPLGDFTVTAAEQGVIPMTDGAFPRRHGESVFPLGTAAGATRPSTGYTFAAIQRQTAGIAAALRAGRAPLPPRAHSRRHRAMDAVLLRALATGRVDGADLLAGLFRNNPLPRVLAFLDGRSTLREEWAIGMSVPVGPMLRSLAELPFLPRLSAPAPPAAPGGPGAPARSAPPERQARRQRQQPERRAP